MLHLGFTYQPIVMWFEHSLSSPTSSEQFISTFSLLIPGFASTCASCVQLVLEAEILIHTETAQGENHADFFPPPLKFQNCICVLVQVLS